MYRYTVIAADKVTKKVVKKRVFSNPDEARVLIDRMLSLDYLVTYRETLAPQKKKR